MKDLGITGSLFATDISRSAPAFSCVDRWALVPRARSVEYIPAIQSIVRKWNIGLIVPLTDLDLRSFARQRPLFEELGCAVMVGDEDSVRICRDKKFFCQHVTNLGMPAIRTMSLDQFREKPFFPCFVKPIHGSGGIGAAQINSLNKLREHIHYFGENLLVQDYIPGKEYTIDVYKTRKGKIKAIVPRQRLVVRTGEVEQGITLKDQMLIEYTEKLTDSLPGLWGVFCCQCRRPDGEKPFFYEINPRFGGGSTLSIQAGANLPKMLMEEVTGRRVSGKVGQFVSHLMVMRYAEDVYRRVKSPELLDGFDSPIFH